MKTLEKVLVSWSGGKDSCLMLHELVKDGRYEITALVCMVKEHEQRISMHGVPVELLDRQAASLGFRLEKVFTTRESDYEAVMRSVVEKFTPMGVAKIAYGDLFLEDILAYRKRLHERIGMAPIFPVWKRNTTAFAHDFIEAGYKAIISCVDAKKLDASFAGRLYDADFLKSLPPEVDPCGENGEFHSFVFDGPLFNEAIRFTPSVPALQRYEDPGHDFQLGFCDLIPIDHVEGGKAGEV
jgi:uncharacterized protein (TIGR00290 family)